MLMKYISDICGFISVAFWILVFILCTIFLVGFLLINEIIDKILIKIGYKGLYNDYLPTGGYIKK